MRYKILAIFLLCLSVPFPIFPANETITVDSYFPSVGGYQDITLNSINTKVVSGTEGEVCYDDGSGGASRGLYFYNGTAWQAVGTGGGGGGGDGHSLDAADGDPVDAIYVDNDGRVGIGTLTPEFDLDVEGGIIARGNFGEGRNIDSLGGLRERAFLWYPRKASLCVGERNEIYYDSDIGNYSTALGEGAEASGQCSAVITTTDGGKIEVSGDYSTFIGTNGVINGTASASIGGISNDIRGNYSTGLGTGADITGNYSTGISRTTGIDDASTVRGDYSTGIGGSHVPGNYSTVIGTSACEAEGNYATAIGYFTGTDGNHSIIFGQGSSTLGRYSTAKDSCLAIGGFKTHLAQPSLTPSLFVSSSSGVGTTGNVGIGTDDPQSKLDINNGTKLPLRLRRSHSLPAGSNIGNTGDIAWGEEVGVYYIYLRIKSGSNGWTRVQLENCP